VCPKFPATIFEGVRMHGSARRVYIGRYTTVADGTRGRDALDPAYGLILGRLEPDGSAPAPVGGVAVPDASYSALHPSGSVVYSVIEQAEGQIEASRVDPATGAVTPIGRVPSGGAEPCHLSVHPDGRYLFTANYGSGSVAVHRLAPDGSIDELCDLVVHQGSGPVPERQNAPHAHMAVPDPSGETVLAVDLGTDSVCAYGLDPGTGRLRPLAHNHMTQGSGPRHLVFHPSGSMLYLANELNSTISACSFDLTTGTVVEQHVVDAAPVGGQVPNYPGGIVLAPGAHTLYWSNRGDQSIAAHRLDHTGAPLEPAGRWPCGGDWPRDLAFTPDGTQLLCANQNSGDVTVFDVHHGSGALNRLGALPVDRAASVLVV
jgi:6-phosphogluconolactonase